MPVFINVQQLHTLLAFAHRAHFVHGDCEFQELVLSVICFLPGSWISSSKWSERSDSLAELLSWLLHSSWKSQSSVTSRSKTVISLVTWITSQPPIVKDSVAYLLSNMLVAVWRWLSPDQRELIKRDCQSVSISLLSVPLQQSNEVAELNGNRKRAAAGDRTLLSSLPTKNPKL